jgi:hypothetical protein
MKDYVEEFSQLVEGAYSELAALSDQQSAQRTASGGWSPREIIGHLIDSASVNHQRFVRAQFQGNLVFPPYSQEDWVKVQQYQDAPWQELLHLWRGFNRHLVRVMASIPEEVRNREHVEHSLDQISWKKVPAGQATTLDYMMEDYVGHLKSHLRQILDQKG